MAFDELLIHTAKIYRRKVGTDRFGQSLGPEATATVTVPARCTAAGGGLAQTEKSRDVFQVTHVVFVAPDVDTVEDDEITVVDANGFTIVENAVVKIKKICYDGVGPHHLEIGIDAQRGPQ